MKFEKRYNPLAGFNFNIFDDPDFQEDSVREEIIVPILKALNYGPDWPNRIVRSKKLIHPFVSIGSKTKDIFIIPDYLFEVNGRFAWILEAKAPGEDILKSKHVEQAYSYAIHSEIRVPYFALCNGREFVLYHISKKKPILHFRMMSLPTYWDNLVKLLSPETVLEYDFSIKKDFGLHLERLGFGEYSNLMFPNVPIASIAKFNENRYTFGSSVSFGDGDTYVVSFDFDAAVMVQLHGKIPHKVFELFSKPSPDETRCAEFVDALYRVNVDCRLCTKLEENEDEIFRPLWINRLVD